MGPTVWLEVPLLAKNRLVGKSSQKLRVPLMNSDEVAMLLHQLNHIHVLLLVSLVD